MSLRQRKSDFMEDFLNQLKDALTKDNVIIGSKRTVKYLKADNVKLVILAQNCPESVKKDIKYYAGLSGLKVEEFQGSAKQLGVFCGKPFSIATIAIKK